LAKLAKVDLNAELNNVCYEMIILKVEYFFMFENLLRVGPASVGSPPVWRLSIVFSFQAPSSGASLIATPIISHQLLTQNAIPASRARRLLHFLPVLSHQQPIS
jgi:hypothetical protein